MDLSNDVEIHRGCPECGEISLRLVKGTVTAFYKIKCTTAGCNFKDPKG